MTTTSIYGSCVARDTAALKSGAWKIANYTARQSMISAVNGRASVEGSIELDSAFQTRMVEADIAGTALSDLQKVSADAEVITIDIMDERLGVYAIGDSYITKTWELEKSGILQNQTGSVASHRIRHRRALQPVVRGCTKKLPLPSARTMCPRSCWRLPLPTAT